MVIKDSSQTVPYVIFASGHGGFLLIGSRVLEFLDMTWISCMTMSKGEEPKSLFLLCETVRPLTLVF